MIRASLPMTAAALAAALAAGCATTPEPPAPLSEARQALEAARVDPRVPRHAPQELNQAGRALEAAEQLWRAGGAPDAVAHRSYLATQEARIAATTAEARAARSEIEQADARRREVIAESQRRQAELARERSAQALQQAEAARQQSAQEREQAEAARQQALAERAQALRAREEAEQARQKAESEIRQLQTELKELQARPTERGWVLTLGSEVLFDVGQATLRPGARRAVDNLAGFLRRYPDRAVMVEGFTDATGSDDLNLRLSQRRAEAVRQALLAAGVQPDRVQARGHGSAYPVASNDTAAGRQLNRRVEIQITEAGGTAAGPSR